MASKPKPETIPEQETELEPETIPESELTPEPETELELDGEEETLPEPETSVETAVRILNEVFILDPRTFEWLANTSFACHDKLAEQNTVQVKTIRMNHPMGAGVIRHEVGMLGILNGILGADIMADIDDSGKMIGFKALEPKEAK